jgi:transcriptional regulator with XRE-family HTH domain
MPNPKSIAGETIRRVRTARGMSQRQLAGDTYTPQYISVLESGRVRPSEKALTYIADRLGVSPGSLLDGEPRSIAPLDSQRLLSAERALEAAAAALRELRESMSSASTVTDGGQVAESKVSDGEPRRRKQTRRTSRGQAGRSGERQPALQLVIADVLRAAGEPLTAGEIAARVTATGWTPPRSGHELRTNQIYARTGHKQYRQLFTRRDGLIGLAEWSTR